MNAFLPKIKFKERSGCRNFNLISVEWKVDGGYCVFDKTDRNITINNCRLILIY